VAANQDTSIPTTPKLLLPDAAFARAPQVAPETECLDANKRSQRKKTTKVSFLDNAEWVLFDVDQPGVQPVVKSCPTSQDKESPRSPRPSLIGSSALSFDGQTSTWDPSDLEKSFDETSREAMRSAATPKARAANPYVLGCCVSFSDRANPDDESIVATPKAGRMKLPAFELDEEPLVVTPQAGSIKLPTFPISELESPSFAPCTTPKTGSSSSTSFGLSEEPQSEDCTTPRASFASGVQFGIWESLPGLGDDLQTDSDTASPSLHNECEVDPLRQQYTYDLSNEVSTLGRSCQSGSIDKSPGASAKCGQTSLVESNGIAPEVL